MQNGSKSMRKIPNKKKRSNQDWKAAMADLISSSSMLRG